MQIGQFARLSGLSIDTLRYYDRLGILRPMQADAGNGYRKYDVGQLSAVNRILALKDAGFTLQEIVSLQPEGLPAAALVRLLERKAADMEDTLQREQRRLARLHSSIFLIKNGGIPLMNEITIKSTEPILACSQRKRIPKAAFDAELEAMWPAVNSYIRDKGQTAITPCMMLYYDGTWTHEGDQLDIEVVEPVPAAFEEKESVQVYQLPGVERMACVVHKGPFSTIGSTYGALFDWLGQNGYTTSGPLREIYHKGDWATKDEGEYITELQVPID